MHPHETSTNLWLTYFPNLLDMASLLSQLHPENVKVADAMRSIPAHLLVFPYWVRCNLNVAV